MLVNSFTLKQLLIAAGLARGIRRAEICRVVDCVQSYITKNLNDENFTKIVIFFKALPADTDTLKYNGVGTLMLDVARLIYSEGEKRINV